MNPDVTNTRIGILGSGFIVNDCHLPAYQKLRLNVVAIASRTKRNAERVAGEHGIETVYESFEICNLEVFCSF